MDVGWLILTRQHLILSVQAERCRSFSMETSLIVFNHLISCIDCINMVSSMTSPKQIMKFNLELVCNSLYQFYCKTDFHFPFFSFLLQKCGD